MAALKRGGSNSFSGVARHVCGTTRNFLIGKTKRFYRDGASTQAIRILQKDPRSIAAERGNAHPQLSANTGRPSAATHATSESCVGAEPKASLGRRVNAQKRLELSTCYHLIMPLPLPFPSVSTRQQPPPLSQLVMKPTSPSPKSCESCSYLVIASRHAADLTKFRSHLQFQPACYPGRNSHQCCRFWTGELRSGGGAQAGWESCLSAWTNCRLELLAEPVFDGAADAGQVSGAAFTGNSATAGAERVR